ncbi:MAG TPA: protein phosphatase 2C domain-containing protein [Gallionella sp.]|nr:protein phosphatase 2C domain-containing protein [Gallionella sp.]
MNFSIHQASHIGNRKYNQDRVAYAYSDDRLLLVLADGMGGHLHGEVAAGSAIDTFVESFGQYVQSSVADPQAFLAGTMRHAHERIMKFPHGEIADFPGTTCIAALVQNGKMYWGHAGDSRLYILRDGAVICMTRDHSMVRQWVELGVITAEQARTHPQRNQITNCLGGIGDMFHMEPGEPITLQSGDVVLLGSDGLWGPFSNQELAEAFFSSPVAEVLDNLVACALMREEGHSDNVTGLAVRWGSSEIAHETAEPVSCILEIT